MTSREKDRDRHEAPLNEKQDCSLNRRNILLGSSALAAAATITSGALAEAPKATPAQATQPATPSAPSGRKPNMLVIFGDDIGQTNISAYSFGVVATRPRTSIVLPKKA
jgi:hypothetical protein